MIKIGCMLLIIPLSIALHIVIIKTNKNNWNQEFKTNYKISQSRTETNKKLILDYISTVNNAIVDGIVTDEEKVNVNKKCKKYLLKWK